MTDEQINEKIAEACGWKRFPETFGQGLWFCPLEPGIKLRGIRSSCPDYCNDLNAMHEAIQSLDHATRVHSFRRGLAKTVGVLSDPDWESSLTLLDKITNATARERAEAFLRTINLWEE